MSDFLKEIDLANLSGPDLQKMGIENPADLNYRVEVSRRLAKRFGAEELLVFDDVAFAVPEAQRPHLKALPGYERILAPALMLLPGFEYGASVLVAAPPNPIEREITLAFKSQLEKRLGKSVVLKVLWENREGNLIDIFSLGEEDYLKLCKEYASYLDDPKNLTKYTPFYHLDVVSQHVHELFGKKTLVIPFQTTHYHYERALGLENVSLPSIPNMDKVRNNFLLRKDGFEDIPFMIGVTSDGRLITNIEELEQLDEEKLPPTDENIRLFTSGIVEAIEKLIESNLDAYIKLDAKGVSGLGNLSPNKYPNVYDLNLTRDERIAALFEIIKSYGFEELPSLAVVEERIKPRIVEGVKQDITVGGIMVGGVFFPMSIFPFGVDEGDEYVCGWMGKNPQDIGIEPELQKKLFESFSKMGSVLATNGYTDGVLAGDVMVGENGKLYVHDYNFRRGGRSYLEALIALTDKPFFEAQIVIDLDSKTDNLRRYEIYTRICQVLYQEGIIPFSTSFGYFGGDHAEGKPDFLKFKLAVPLEHQIISGLGKNDMLVAVENYIKSLL